MDSKLMKLVQEMKSGSSPARIGLLLDTYYQCVICRIDENLTDEAEDLPFHEELLKPLSERESGIAEALAVLTERDHDDLSCALQLAVGYADEPMTAFLLAGGADPRSWPDMDDDPAERNWYLENIDIHYTDACFEQDEVLKGALLRTAQTAADALGARNIGGICLSIDENGRVALHPPMKKF